MQLEQFIHKWRGSALRERQGYQEHFRDLCALFGHQFPSEADTQGDWFCFEYGVAKQQGGDGWADVFKKGYFGWEYKGKHKDLDAAYRQLLDYRVSLLNPPLLIVCDFDRFRIHTNFTNCENGCYEFNLASLPEKSALKPELTNFEVLRAVFESPEALRIGRDPLLITEDAAQSLGDIAIRMRKRGVDPMQAAHFVMKLMFCLFAEDVGLFGKDAAGQPIKPLTSLLKRTHNNISRDTTNRFIAQLLELMASGGELGFEAIPWFNGGLFDGSPGLPLENGEALQLERAADFDWGRIEPSIFGTLLERSLDPKRQQQLGAHYTRPEEVLKVIEPVVLEPLREEWFDARARLQLLAGPKHEKARRTLLEDCLKRLREVRILDPACGSGNFLYLALRAVMDLEDEVRRFAHKEGIPVLAEERVGPEILLGREIDEYAQQLASTVIWIGYIQKRLEVGSYTDQPLLRPLKNIVLADSLLNPDGTRATWQACDYIVGNPPFLGYSPMRQALGKDYCQQLSAAYEEYVDGLSDLCAYFHEQARWHIMQGLAKRAGLLATNSIRFGDSRKVLARINEDTPIFNAWSDMEWVLDGAAVRISIISYAAEGEVVIEKCLDGERAESINTDLTTGLDLTRALKLKENAGISFIGDKKFGPFELTVEQAERMLKAKGNPHSKPNSDVIKLWLNGRMFLHPHWKKMYIIDFGTDMAEEEAAKYVLPFEWVKEKVYPLRIDNPVTHRREKWWIHGSPSTYMRRAIARLDRFLATPEVTETRAFRFLPSDVIPDGKLVVFAFDNWYSFGILQSNIHEFWTRGRASDLRGWTSYGPTTVFETFPFPRISPHLRERYALGEDSSVGPTAVSAINPDADCKSALPGQSRTETPAPPAGGLNAAPTQERPETAALQTAALQDADALIAAVETAARELYEMRDRVVFSGDPACDSYTALYKAMPAWLKNAHAKLDSAVLACYGLAPTASKHEILEFLLDENLARSG